MKWSTIRDRGIKIWDKIVVKTYKPDKDPRPESRKIDNKSVENCGCAIKDRDERRIFLNAHTDAFIPDATKTKRTLSIIKPILFRFSVNEKHERSKQVTLGGDTFKVQPYGDISLIYQFKCGEKGCAVCSRVRKFHFMECFDFGANLLYTKYENKKVAKEKVRERCYTKMKAECDCWFAMGTHSQYPFLKWMVVGLLWMKKAS